MKTPLFFFSVGLTFSMSIICSPLHQLTLDPKYKKVIVVGSNQEDIAILINQHSGLLEIHSVQPTSVSDTLYCIHQEQRSQIRFSYTSNGRSTSHRVNTSFRERVLGLQLSNESTDNSAPTTIVLPSGDTGDCVETYYNDTLARFRVHSSRSLFSQQSLHEVVSLSTAEFSHIQPPTENCPETQTQNWQMLQVLHRNIDAFSQLPSTQTYIAVARGERLFLVHRSALIPTLNSSQQTMALRLSLSYPQRTQLAPVNSLESTTSQGSVRRRAPGATGRQRTSHPTVREATQFQSNQRILAPQPDRNATMVFAFLCWLFCISK